MDKTDKTTLILLSVLVMVLMGAVVAGSSSTTHRGRHRAPATSGTSNTAGPNGSDRAYQIGWKGGHILYNDGIIPEAVSGRCIIAVNTLAARQQIEPTASGDTIQACLDGYKAASNGN